MTTNFRSFGASLLAVATLVTSSACLRVDKTHTLYVSADGVVTWMVIEKDVRSDERDAAKAAAEEHDYITRARVGTHPVAHAFRLLNAIDVSTGVVRDRRPFTVITTARFASLDALGQALIDALGSDATSTLTVEGSRIRWALTFMSDDSTKDDVDDDLMTLFDVPWRIVLEEGRLVSAERFRIDSAHIAVQLTDGDEPDDGQPLVWSLTWIK